MQSEMRLIDVFCFKGTSGRPGVPGSKGLPGEDRESFPVPGKKGNFSKFSLKNR